MNQETIELPSTEDIWETVSMVFHNAQDQLRCAEYLGETSSWGHAISHLAIATQEAMKAGMLAAADLDLFPALDLLRESLLSSPLAEEFEFDTPENYLHSMLHMDRTRHDTGILLLFFLKIHPRDLVDTDGDVSAEIASFRFARSVVRTIQDRDFYIACNWLKYLHEAMRMGQAIYWNKRWRTPDDATSSDFERVHYTVESLFRDMEERRENWSEFVGDNGILPEVSAIILPRAREILPLVVRYILPEIQSFHAALQYVA